MVIVDIVHALQAPHPSDTIMMKPVLAIRQRARTLLSLGMALAAVTSAGGAQTIPPIRQLGATMAASKEPLGNVVAVRHLPGGRVLVNDPGTRRLLTFDSTLANPVVVADSTSATANAYAGRIAGLIAYRGDSTLFVDPTTMSMLVVDPAGKIARVMSVPRTQDAMLLTGGGFGTPAFDGQGRLLYRANNFVFPARPPNGGPPSFPPQPDTAAIIRVDLGTRQVDTAAFIKVPKVNMTMSQDANGRMMMQSQINPLPVVDEWAVLSNGAIALIRGRDYHIDWINPDGTKASSPKLPFDWQRLSDEDKVALIDSVKAMRERMAASGNMVVNGQTTRIDNGSGTVTGQRVAAPPGGGGGEQRVMVFGGGDGGGRGGPAPGGNFTPPPPTYVAPSELPDYKPPFFAGAVRADADGNLWIRTIPTKAIPGGPVYDVVNQRGELLERVQVPAGRTIVGFGAGGVVYLTARDGTTLTLERAHAR
jgi:hypothetical protein